MIQLNVKVELNDAAKRFPTLARKIPRLAANALNETAVYVRKEGITKVATELKLPRSIVGKRFSLSGEAKRDRITLRKATAGNLAAVLNTYVRGIPVSQVAGVQLKRKGGGVKAKGGRFYEGAFKAKGLVFKRQGPQRTPLMVPKIGVRELLDKEFRGIFDRDGRRVFSERLRRRLQFEVSRS